MRTITYIFNETGEQFTFTGSEKAAYTLLLMLANEQTPDGEAWTIVSYV